MRGLRIITVLSLTVLTLAGCHKRPAEKAQPPKQNFVAAFFAPQCPAEPSKEAVQEGIHAAMLQIYGVDEVSAKFTVLQLAATDCKHFTVTFRASPAGSAMQTSALAYGDDGKWSLTLYGKQYALN